ncbi:unnamed protein product, partial [Amoebophrya sp. A25]
VIPFPTIYFQNNSYFVGCRSRSRSIQRMAREYSLQLRVTSFSESKDVTCVSFSGLFEGEAACTEDGLWCFAVPAEKEEGEEEPAEGEETLPKPRLYTAESLRIGIPSESALLDKVS